MSVRIVPSAALPRVIVISQDPPELRVSLARQGPSGPAAVSADEGQLLRLGSDHLPLATGAEITPEAISAEPLGAVSAHAGAFAHTLIATALQPGDAAAPDHDHAADYEPLGAAASTTRGTVTISAVSLALAAAPRQTVEVIAAGQTVTLPASPTAGDEVIIGVGDFTDTLVARNGQLIGGLAEDMTIDVATASTLLAFIGGAMGWRVQR